MAVTQPQLELKVHRLEVQNHWIIGIAIVAIVALVALFAWAALPRITTPDGARATEDLAALWSGHQAEDVATVYAEGATFTSADGMSATGLGAIGEWVSMGSYIDFTATATGPVVQQGDTVVVPMTLSWYGQSEGETMASQHEQEVLTFIQLDDAGRIVSQRDYGADAVVLP